MMTLKFRCWGIQNQDDLSYSAKEGKIKKGKNKQYDTLNFVIRVSVTAGLVYNRCDLSTILTDIIFCNQSFLSLST